MQPPTLDIAIEDSLVQPGDRRNQVLFRKSGDTTWYRVFLRLTGRDIAFIKSATYRLHETFTPREITVERSPSNPDCRFEVWMWGTFDMTAIVRDVRNREHLIAHTLRFDQDLEPEAAKEKHLNFFPA
jgi:transcription initiation factor IIF auxiliary subunit